MQNEPTTRGAAAAYLLAALALIGVGVLLLLTRPQPVKITLNTPLPTSSPQPTNTPGPLVVYVTGAVMQPDTLITLPSGSRAQDAIDAAGGSLPDADLSAVNLAALLRDGDLIHVPSRSAETVNQPPTPNRPALVRINSATVDELMTLPGIGEVTANAIIAYREANGPFTDLDALDAVDGIGPSTVEEIAEFIVFD